MNRFRSMVRPPGIARFVAPTELWGTAGLLADTLPLEHPPVYPRPLRQIGHCLRLILWDRAVTNRDATAVLVISRTPWVVAGGAAIAAATLSPKLPPWPRRILIATAVVFAVRKQRLRRYIRLRRRLRRVAPGGVMSRLLIAREAGSRGMDHPNSGRPRRERTRHHFVATLPGARRDALGNASTPNVRPRVVQAQRRRRKHDPRPRHELSACWPRCACCQAPPRRRG
jgi:hypothetical protein